jgi:hypothetical protein
MWEMFKNGIIRRTFGCKRNQEDTEGIKYYNLYFSSNIASGDKSETVAELKNL